MRENTDRQGIEIMKTFEYNVTALWGECLVRLINGNIIKLSDEIAVEIGPENTMRGLINGKPDQKGWKPITEEAVKPLCIAKFTGAKNNAQAEISKEMVK